MWRWCLWHVSYSLGVARGLVCAGLSRKQVVPDTRQRRLDTQKNICQDSFEKRCRNAVAYENMHRGVFWTGSSATYGSPGTRPPSRVGTGHASCFAAHRDTTRRTGLGEGSVLLAGGSSISARGAAWVNASVSGKMPPSGPRRRRRPGDGNSRLYRCGMRGWSLHRYGN
jgi:hypothetical protein